MRCIGFCTLLVICLGCHQSGAGTARNADSTSRPDECSDTAAVHKIQIALSIPYVLDMTAEEFAENNVDTPLQGLQWIKRDTNYNEHCLLGVTVTTEWSAAYVQDATDYFLFDKHTGARLTAKDLLKKDSLVSLSKQLFDEIAETARTHREEIAADTEYAKDVDEYDAQVDLSPIDITTNANVKFYISSKGLTFLYEYSFGHAFWAIEPADAELVLSVEDLQPYIKPGGPLSFWLKR